MTMDARGFVTSVYRLAPPTERPGERIGSQLGAEADRVGLIRPACA